LIQDEINRQIVHYRSQIAGLLSSSEDAKILDVLSQTIAEKEKEIQEKERSLERIMEAYEEGVYSLTEFNQRMESRKREISVLEEEILTLQKQFNSEQTPCNEEKLTYLDQAMEKLKSKDLTDKELNELYKTIIDHITWRREGNTIEVEVHFI
jgi:hypothetical protein